MDCEVFTREALTPQEIKEWGPTRTRDSSWQADTVSGGEPSEEVVSLTGARAEGIDQDPLGQRGHWEI